MKNKGGYAFPLQKYEGCYTEGMTLRDYFAGQALVGLSGRGYSSVKEAELAASIAYAYADAMLAQREK